MGRGRTKTDPVRRFWSRVAKGDGDGCWEWSGALTTSGYPQFHNGERQENGHRFSFRIHHELDVIPKGLCVCHHCDNPKCVRPDHLFLGTHADNMRDSVKKGRRARTGYVPGIYDRAPPPDGLRCESLNADCRNERCFFVAQHEHGGKRLCGRHLRVVLVADYDAEIDKLRREIRALQAMRRNAKRQRFAEIAAATRIPKSRKAS